MGGSSSKLEKALSDSTGDEHYFGLENFGNTCYANSVLQALYFCKPFRQHVLAYAASLPKDAEEDLLSCLAELFTSIHTAKKKTGVYAPKKFMTRVKKDNELFRSFMHQDAHEFLNYLLNECGELLEKQAKAAAAAASTSASPNGTNGTPAGRSGSATGRSKASARPADASGNDGSAASSNGAATASPGCASGASTSSEPPRTFVHDVFQGKLVNETRCMLCETVTSREEVFMDLSLEIENNASLTSCLKAFSATETLDREDKFSCDTCGCLQEAQKRMKVRSLPACLICHLKRFKYVEAAARLRKLMYRVAFPMELKLSNTTDDAEGSDCLYSLFAVVVHVGSGPHHGHYVCLIKAAAGTWLQFDDEHVEAITEQQVQATFGSTQEGNGSMEHGYILFYEKAADQ